MKEPRILVVDDDRTSLLLVTKVLQKAHYLVVTAQDTSQAVMQAHREAPDLIITDIVMPGGGGLTVLERLVMSVKTNAIPIIVLTGSGTPDIESRALAAGAVRVLRKPCDAALLLEAVTEALGASK